MNLILYRGPNGLQLCEEPPRDDNFVDLVLGDRFDLSIALSIATQGRATPSAETALVEGIERMNQADIEAGHVCRGCGCSEFNACSPPCHCGC